MENCFFDCQKNKEIIIENDIEYWKFWCDCAKTWMVYKPFQGK